MGTPIPKGAGVKVKLPRKAKVSQDWPWVFCYGRATIEASPRVFQKGEASD